jgi:menaquinone-dependent protoporphyrinogen oxidase
VAREASSGGGANEVWVVVASRYGSTREIGEAIDEELKRDGHDCRVLDVEEVRSFTGAGAVILGSAVYAGRWLKPARKLLEARGRELRGRPSWLFSSGPTGDPPLPEEAEPVGIDEALEATGARSHQIFAGRIELERLKRRERLLVSAMRAPVGDYRDWDAIRSWARTIGRELDGTAAS